MGEPQNFYKSTGIGENFFENLGPKCKRHNGIVIRNKCTKSRQATSNGSAKKIGGTSKFLQVHREGEFFFSKKRDQNINVIMA